MANTITLAGTEYRGITSALLMRSVLTGDYSLHLRRSLNFSDGEVLTGDHDHLHDLYRQCQVAGIPCERTSLD